MRQRLRCHAPHHNGCSFSKSSLHNGTGRPVGRRAPVDKKQLGRVVVKQAARYSGSQELSLEFSVWPGKRIRDTLNRLGLQQATNSPEPTDSAVQGSFTTGSLLASLMASKSGQVSYGLSAGSYPGFRVVEYGPICPAARQVFLFRKWERKLRPSIPVDGRCRASPKATDAVRTRQG